MHTLRLELGERSYAIHSGAGLLQDAEFLRQQIREKRLFLVSDENVARHHLAPVEAALRKSLVGRLILPPGEQEKNLDNLKQIFDALAACGIGRDGALLALGGGVVGDITGFAAASWQRGIRFYQLPTTLLAQVDASVGGKTAVNHPAGKNLIGAFHQPACVIADTDALATLPDREFRAGLAEVIKHALVADREFLTWLERRAQALKQRDPETVAECVIRCCQIKAAVVAADERELGQRAILNFGHTFGHVIEGAGGYGEWLHGEAVAAGMALALELSRQLGNIEVAERDRCLSLMMALALPVLAPDFPKSTWLEWMARDKKSTSEGLRFVVLAEIGRAVLRDDISEQQLRDTLNWRPMDCQ